MPIMDKGYEGRKRCETAWKPQTEKETDSGFGSKGDSLLMLIQPNGQQVPLHFSRQLILREPKQSRDFSEGKKKKSLHNFSEPITVTRKRRRGWWRVTDRTRASRRIFKRNTNGCNTNGKRGRGWGKILNQRNDVYVRGHQRLVYGWKKSMSLRDQEKILYRQI